LTPSQHGAEALTTTPRRLKPLVYYFDPDVRCYGPRR